jgi:hypothetical protein
MLSLFMNNDVDIPMPSVENKNIMEATCLYPSLFRNININLVTLFVSKRF